jgi:glycosyltransferase involved in cell wall biosynthesis
MTSLSIISPVYCAEGIIDELVRRIRESAISITTDYEIILVEDCSPDQSWKEIERNCMQDDHVIGVKLTRNFGQHNAIAAGMEIARGEFVVVMDCDLQHDPACISQMYRLIQDGYDLVLTQVKERQHDALKSFAARGFYKLLAHLSDFDMDPNIGNFSLLSRRVVDAYNNYNDYHKAYLWALHWTGFKAAIVKIDHKPRMKGKSAYSWVKLIKHALNVAVANSDRLLYLAVFVGIFFSFAAVLGMIIIIYRYFTLRTLEGWSSLMVTIMFFSGIILLSMGIIGIYLGKVFEQTKGRPRYIISRVLNSSRQP